MPDLPRSGPVRIAGQDSTRWYGIAGGHDPFRGDAIIQLINQASPGDLMLAQVQHGTTLHGYVGT
jgi:hypothetical protein